MTHPQQTTRKVIEQLVGALEEWERVDVLGREPHIHRESWKQFVQDRNTKHTAAIAAGQQALEQTQVEAEPEWNDENVIAYCIARGISAAKAFTTGATQPQVEPAPSPEVLQALADPENQPNQFGVVFGMHGPRMFFAIGNQSFDLAYEPDEPEEFEFMKRMLCSAFSTFTPDVKTAPAPSTAGERDNKTEMLAKLTAWLDSLGGKLHTYSLRGIALAGFEEGWSAARSQPTTEESLVVAVAQPVREPLTPDTHYQEWKHGCDSMCTNITLWIDRCPHCGKPRPVVEAAHGITKKGAP